MVLLASLQTDVEVFSCSTTTPFVAQDSVPDPILYLADIFPESPLVWYSFLVVVSCDFMFLKSNGLLFCRMSPNLGFWCFLGNVFWGRKRQDWNQALFIASSWGTYCKYVSPGYVSFDHLVKRCLLALPTIKLLLFNILWGDSFRLCKYCFLYFAH
jgi:hypothetical protein